MTAVEQEAPAATDPEKKQATTDYAYDPRKVFIIAERAEADEPGVLNFLPVEGDEFHIRSGRHGKTPFVFLDAVAYIERHLREYREGWAAWLEEWQASEWPALFYFNDLTDDPTGADPDAGISVDAAVYLGVWLRGRVLADVVAQHGGKPDDYQVGFAWAPWMIDHIAVHLPEVDPERPPRDNHWLITNPDQQELVTRVAAGEAG